MSPEAKQVLELMGQGMGLRVPHDAALQIRLFDMAPRGELTTTCPVLPAVAVELVESGQLKRMESPPTCMSGAADWYRLVK